MANPSTSAVYIHVIEDVVSKVKDEFIQSGAGESVLNELQAIWEMKMMHCGAICGAIERPSLPKSVADGNAITTGHDLNMMPYEGTEEYETPTAEMLFPPTPIQTPIETPLPGTTDQAPYQLPTPSEYSTPQDNGGVTDVKPGRPSPYMQPPSAWINKRPVAVDVNVAYIEGRDELDRGASNQHMTQDLFTMSSGKRKREDIAPPVHTSECIPQQDGAADAAYDALQPEACKLSLGGKCQMSKSFDSRHHIPAGRDMLLAQETGASSRIPQLDGPIADSYEGLYPYQGVANEDYNIVTTPAAHIIQASTPVGAQIGAGNDDDDDDEPLNEDDDDDDINDMYGEEPSTEHLVLTQFEKVTRTKNRWKCILKDGIMRINDKDILFTKATGEFDF